MIEEKNVPFAFPPAVDAVMAAVSEFFGRLGKDTAFETLGDESGTAVFIDEGNAIESETEDITGARRRVYSLPMKVVYRAPLASEDGRRFASRALEALGDWLTGERVRFEGMEMEPVRFPVTAGWKITRVTRKRSYIERAGKDRVCDRALPLTAEYEREI